MTSRNAFETYLIRFLNEHIRTIPDKSYFSVQDFQTDFLLMLKGWELLKIHPLTSSQRLSELQPLMDMIDKFNTSLKRPLELDTLQTALTQPLWKKIKQDARRIFASYCV